jgi:S-DNA-T family DNA segregation ATPase FtsK/SpoIIIE
LNFGIMADGSPFVEDLATYPHLLIGGSTGTGKSVCLNQLISSLISVRSPQQLQMLLIDPKTVELFPYRNIPHMLRPPISNVWHVIEALEDVIRTMRDRTAVLHDHKVLTIKELNTMFKSRAAELLKEGKPDQANAMLQRCWHYIVIVIDEMAEIVLQKKKDFIERMATLSSMARASGISIISATQRPSVDVLPGKIKVNFLARAAFRMPSARDSQTVLNERGAERLLGRGDLFVVSPDKNGLQRVHVAHCRPEDRDAIIKRVVDFGYDEKGMLRSAPIVKK